MEKFGEMSLAVRRAYGLGRPERGQIRVEQSAMEQTAPRYSPEHCTKDIFCRDCPDFGVCGP
jgi:hypothetical protein